MPYQKCLVPNVFGIMNFLDVRKFMWCITTSGWPANIVVTILTVLSWLLLTGG